MKAIGIDLGTTNSATAYYNPDRGTVSVLTNSEGDTLTPSAVSLRRRGDEDTLLVGRMAVNWAAREPGNTVVSVKRLMGRDFADPTIAEARGRLNYRVVPGSDDDPRAHVMIGDRMFSPTEVSSLILEKLKRDAGRTLGDEVTEAVITVPAYFHDAQRRATREAGELAGLAVTKVVDEPTAAAVAFGLEAPAEDRRRVLVYDLGGGTFDISILHSVRDQEGNSYFQVLDYIGDNWLGGDDFDLVILDRIVEWVKERAGIDPSGDPSFLFTAKAQAEQAKRQLGQTDEAEVLIPGACRIDGGPLVDVEMKITRPEFDALIEPFVAKTMTLVQGALGRQGLTPDDISDVLLVGGSTLTPKVYSTVESFFGTAKVRRNINPMECVALGAAVLAARRRGLECPACGKVNEESAETCGTCETSLVDASVVGDTGIYDVTGMALGIAAVKGTDVDAFVPIIPRGTAYPLPEPMRQSFKATDARRINVPVYQGDQQEASKNWEIGVVEFALPEEIDVNSRVDVSFNYDADKLVTVTVSVPGTALLHSSTLRTDSPRTASPAAEESDAASCREDLVNLERFAEQFLEQYEPYIEPAHAMKMRRDLDLAQQARAYSNPTECRRMCSVLDADVFGAGVATQMFLAERAANGAAPAVTRLLNETVGSLRESIQRGDHETASEQARYLKLQVAKALQDRQVDEVADADDYGGRLRTDAE